VCKFWGRVWGQGYQNWGFGVKNGGFPEKKTQEKGDVFWCNSLGRVA